MNAGPRAIAGERRWTGWTPWLFLGLAAAGASPAAWTALWTRHAGRQQEALLPRLLNITGIQIGLVIGALWWWIAG